MGWVCGTQGRHANYIHSFSLETWWEENIVWKP